MRRYTSCYVVKPDTCHDGQENVKKITWDDIINPSMENRPEGCCGLPIFSNVMGTPFAGMDNEQILRHVDTLADVCVDECCNGSDTNVTSNNNTSCTNFTRTQVLWETGYNNATCNTDNAVTCDESMCKESDNITCNTDHDVTYKPVLWENGDCEPDNNDTKNSCTDFTRKPVICDVNYTVTCKIGEDNNIIREGDIVTNNNNVYPDNYSCFPILSPITLKEKVEEIIIYPELEQLDFNLPMELMKEFAMYRPPQWSRVNKAWNVFVTNYYLKSKALLNYWNRGKITEMVCRTNNLNSLEFFLRHNFPIFTDVPRSIIIGSREYSRRGNQFEECSAEKLPMLMATDEMLLKVLEYEHYRSVIDMSTLKNFVSYIPEQLYKLIMPAKTDEELEKLAEELADKLELGSITILYEGREVPAYYKRYLSVIDHLVTGSPLTIALNMIDRDDSTLLYRVACYCGKKYKDDTDWILIQARLLEIFSGAIQLWDDDMYGMVLAIAVFENAELILTEILKSEAAKNAALHLHITLKRNRKFGFDIYDSTPARARESEAGKILAKFIAALTDFSFATRIYWRDIGDDDVPFYLDMLEKGLRSGINDGSAYRDLGVSMGALVRRIGNSTELDKLFIRVKELTPEEYHNIVVPRIRYVRTPNQ